MNDIESLSRLTEAVEKAGADIAPTYIEYVQLAFAIATDCGEAGRDCFHRLCRLSAKYQREHAERVFSNAMATHHGDVHLGTVFHLAENTGVTPDKQEAVNNSKNAKNAVNAPTQSSTHTCAHNKVREEEAAKAEEMMAGSEPLHPLPTFPKADWPEILNRIICYGANDMQRDILLLGTLTTLGSSMERYVRCLYSRQYQYPCMQTFIVAPSTSGKRAMAHLRLLVDPIHDELRQEYADKMKAYKKDKAAYEAMGKERSKTDAPEKPVNKLFLISGNNTGTGILQNLMDADGTGFILESEADTISTAIGSEYGHWSDTLRKAFDHDRLSYNRRTNEEYREIMKCFLSILISGTPGQVKTLIPTGENGLFARQNFYYMLGIWQWISQFDNCEEDLEEIFRAIGLEWKKQLDLLKEHGIHTLRLTQEQKDEFDALFSDLFYRSSIANDKEMYGSVARMAVNICRMMSEVAVMRILENPDPYQLKNPTKNLTPDKNIPADNIKDGIITRWDVAISDEDFRAVLGLATPLYCHATHILSFLPPTEMSHRSNSTQDYFFDVLGKKFTRAQMIKKANEMGIKENTVCSWLTRLMKRGVIVNDGERGCYTRAYVCVREGAPE